MPVLPLSADQLTAPDLRILTYLETLMLWPDDPDKAMHRARGVIPRAARQLLEGLPDEYQTSVGNLRQMEAIAAQAPVVGAEIDEDRARCRLGAAVGDIIMMVLRAREMNPQGGASLQAAKLKVAAHMGVSVARLDKADCWPRFRPVAHLWAAWRLIYCTINPDPARATLLNSDHLAAFIITADGILRAASGRAKQSSVPYLDPKECWTVPDDLPFERGRVRFARPTVLPNGV